MKHLFTAAAMLFSMTAFAQVGINNTSPKATLDITAKTTDGSKPEGLIAPRLTGNQIQLGTYGAAQLGTIIYATTAATAPNAFTTNITAPGYYYFDGSVWQKMTGAAAGDTTNDAWINDTTNGLVKLGTKADGTTRVAGSEFVAQDNGSVGIGTSSPAGSSILQLDATDKGFVPPRMTALQRDAITTPLYGTVIYNTDQSCMEQYVGGSGPGISSTGWKSLCSSNINSSVTSVNCTGVLTGNYYSNVQMTTANTKTVTINFTTAGDYSASTDEVNGVYFVGQGTVNTSGSKNIVLTASGTPMADGTFTYTVTTDGKTCTFSVTYTKAPVPINSIDCLSGTPAAGTYTTGVAMTASNTKNISVDVGTGFGTSNTNTFSTNVVNGVQFTKTITFPSSGVQAVTLVASGIPISTGTFTYTVSGLNTSQTCTFTVTYDCNKVTTGNLFSALGNTPSASIGHRFTITAPGPGRFLLKGSAQVWTDNGSYGSWYAVKYGSTTLTYGAINAMAWTNVYQNVPFNTSLDVSAAGSYNIDIVKGYATGIQQYNLEYIFLPSGTQCQILSLDAKPFINDVNNLPSSMSHRYSLTAPAAGKFILLPQMQVWSAATSTNGFDLKNGSSVIASARLASAAPEHLFNNITTAGEFSVSSAGNYNFDLVPTSTINGTFRPGLASIFIPATATGYSSGNTSTTTVNSGAGSNSHRFTVNAPAAGKLLLFGSVNLLSTTGATLGYDVKVGTSTLQNMILPAIAPSNRYQNIPFATEYTVTSSGPVNIDLVPINTNSTNMQYPVLQWVFIPN
ncbi:hypothetical protein [Chryseobacterium taeanense]|uniref:hypothetical protein n=1 Tax=Chryseobacterium taeanense TaxID=311334 RepID=UPI0035B20AC2